MILCKGSIGSTTGTDFGESHVGHLMIYPECQGHPANDMLLAVVSL